MNKKTVALTEEQYQRMIHIMREGFITGDEIVKPNNRIATALTLEANLGLRISDILNLHLKDIVNDGGRYRLDITEQKTQKRREFTVPIDIYVYVQNYALENKISPEARLFDLSERAVAKHLAKVCIYLRYGGIGTHSFRKFFATSIYVNSHYNIEVVRILLQHSSAAITQRYIGIQRQEIEEALQNHIKLL